jgi:hypothetical protein
MSALRVVSSSRPLVGNLHDPVVGAVALRNNRRPDQGAWPARLRTELLFGKTDQIDKNGKHQRITLCFR